MDFLSNILPLACGLQATISFQIISSSPLGMLRSWPALLDILENPYKNSHLYWPQLCSNRGWKGSRGARLGMTGYAPSPGSLWFPPREKGLFPSFCLFARLCLAASHWLSPLLGLAPWTSGSQVLWSQDSLCPLTGYWGPQRALVYVCCSTTNYHIRNYNRERQTSEYTGSHPVSHQSDTVLACHTVSGKLPRNLWENEWKGK